jgi:ketosteroid isomerase-like protein
MLRAMSEENIEIVRRAYAAALRKPNPDFETANALFDREHLLVPIATTVEGRTLRGAEGFREYLADLDGVFRSWEAKIVETEELDDERVLAEAHHVGLSREAGVPWEENAWYLATLRDGRIVRTDAYRSRHEALEAAGLSE